MSLQPLNVGPNIAANQQLGGVLAANRQRREQSKEARRRTMFALAGGALAAVAGPAVVAGLSPIQAAGLGAQAGGAIASGDPVALGMAGLNAAGLGQQGVDRETAAADKQREERTLQTAAKQAQGTPSQTVQDTELSRPMPGLDITRSGPTSTQTVPGLAPNLQGAFTTLLGSKKHASTAMSGLATLRGQSQAAAAARANIASREETARANIASREETARQNRLTTERGQNIRARTAERGQNFTKETAEGNRAFNAFQNNQSRRLQRELKEMGITSAEDIATADRFLKEDLTFARTQSAGDISREQIDAANNRAKEEIKVRRELANMSANTKGKSPNQLLVELLEKRNKGPLTALEKDMVRFIGTSNSRDAKFAALAFTDLFGDQPKIVSDGGGVGGTTPTPNTKAEYDALPSGSAYIDPDDPNREIRIKP